MLATLLRIALLTSVVAAASFGQTPCYAENDTNNYWDISSQGAPGLLAIQFVSTFTGSVSRIEIFTGETTGTNTVSIWTHDSATGHPGAPVSAAGSWPMSSANSWQGADLGASAALTSGTTYWVMWGFAASSQSSLDLPTTVLGQPFDLSVNGGTTWLGPYQLLDHHWKFRLYGTCGGTGVTPFCSGDGTQLTACPCGNNGNLGHGCQNSIGAGGAHLTSTGTTSPDALVLTSANELQTTLSIVHQGDASVPGTVFGDGVLCLSGNLHKLYVKHASGGIVIAPGAGDPSITQRSAAMGDTIPSGATRYYQVVYRDPTPGFCSSPAGSTFNVSNGLTVVW